MKSPFQILHPKAFQVLLLTVLAFAAAGASAQSDELMTLNIKPQKAGSALVTLAQSSGTQILFAEGAATHVEVDGLKGEYRLEEALAALLADTGLEYSFTAENLILVQDVEPTEEPEEADEAPVEEEEEPLKLGAQTVTGTRLVQGNPAARVLTITAEDIARRGISTVEDVVRTIPQIFSSINATNTMDQSQAIDINLGALAVGVSTANLRGFGSANTLVLLNGHRIAGLAGHEDFFVNVRNMPAGAIERVEVNLDGGSSVYGSDGVAGVINIITRKDFAGGKVTVRREQSSTGADQTQYSGYFGYNWDSGGVSLNLSRTDGRPYSTREAGYYTKDWSFMFGGDQAYNFNLNDSGNPYYTRSARIGFISWGPYNLILPEGHDGRNAQVSDFRMVTPADAIEVIDMDAGGAMKDDSITFNFEQTFADRVRVRGEYYRTEAKTHTRLGRFNVSALAIPATNAFNPFGQTVYSEYDPQTEIALGLIPPSERVGTSIGDRILAGFDIDFSEDHKLTVDWLNSKSKSENYQYMWTNRSRGPLAVENYPERVQELLASSDPNEAINLFGDGTGQNPTIAEMVAPHSTDSLGTEVNKIEAFLYGRLFELPGGEVGFVLGGERRKEENADLSGFNLWRLGIDRPYRELEAYFVEFSVPVFGDDNALPGIPSLVVTASARRDDYTVEGSIEDDADRNPILQKNRFGNTSLGYGVKMDLTDTFTIRVKSDEGFRAPAFVDLYGGTRFFYNSARDPLLGERVYTATMVWGPNPELKAEHSDNRTVGLEWRPGWAQGLTIKVDYTEIDYRDRIAHTQELLELLPREIYGNLPQFVRDADGKLIRLDNIPTNISRRESRTLDGQISWQIDTLRFGSFTPGLYYHYVIEMYDQAAPDSAKVAFLDEYIGIDKRKIQGRLDWVWNRLTVSAFGQYTPGYWNNYHSTRAASWYAEPRVPDAPVDSRLTVDVSATYRWDNGLLLRIGGRNIFDADFPFVLNVRGKPYDARRVDVRGQVWFAEVSFEF